MRASVFAAALCCVAATAACTQGGPYEAYAKRLQADGLLRAETAPVDAPFSNEDLVRNFENIALHSEFRRDGGRVVAEKTERRLARWDKPVITYRLEGAGVTTADIAEYAALSRRLSELTGIEMRRSVGRADITVGIYGEAERLAFARDLRRRGLAQRMALVMAWARSDNLPCVGQIGFSRDNDDVISTALIVIKDELKGDYRRLCIHEEFAQTLGLINDDASARPSIFNDDQEFALLTEHDEFLLRMLYDPALSAGMTLAEAKPLLPEVIGKLRPDG